LIPVKKLDGSMMHINEDLVERVEGGAAGQSAVYLVDGGHIIVADDPVIVVERIRTEKVGVLGRVLQGPVSTAGPQPLSSSVTRLGPVSDR
jgi:uncharacterized protein YlzI (FlbEa/FlbD family)